MDERRRHKRYPVVLGSEIGSGENESMFGLTQDVSQSGARLLAMIPFEAGTQLELRILIASGDETSCKASVVRENTVSDRGMWQFEIAVEFEDLLDEDLVSNLISIANSGEL